MSSLMITTSADCRGERQAGRVDARPDHGEAQPPGPGQRAGRPVQADDPVRRGCAAPRPRPRHRHRSRGPGCTRGRRRPAAPRRAAGPCAGPGPGPSSPGPQGSRRTRAAGRARRGPGPRLAAPGGWAAAGCVSGGRRRATSAHRRPAAAGPWPRRRPAAKPSTAADQCSRSARSRASRPSVSRVRWSSGQRRPRGRELALVPDQQPGLAVHDRVAQAGHVEPDRRGAPDRGLGDHDAPALDHGRVQQHPGRAQQAVLLLLRHPPGEPRRPARPGPRCGRAPGRRPRSPAARRPPAAPAPRAAAAGRCACSRSAGPAPGTAAPATAGVSGCGGSTPLQICRIRSGLTPSLGQRLRPWTRTR